jgi:toxin ParE1/3/4
LAEIGWTQEAQTWLRDIYDYIAADNLDAAAQTVSGIYQRAQLLKQHPEIGYRHETAGLRRFESFSTVTIESLT